MTTIKNPDFYKMFSHEGTRVVTVSVSVVMDDGTDDSVILRNAADAIKFYADNGVHKAWEKEIAID